MKNVIALFVILLCLFISSCHRPVAYLQPTSHPAASRFSVNKPTPVVDVLPVDSASEASLPVLSSRPVNSVVANRTNQPVQETNGRVERRIRRIQSLLSTPLAKPTDKQPDPKPKKKLKLGNQIRQSLGMRLRPELNWWQRISWKLKASVLVILVAVLFAILHITILAIIFGILGAFLLISGLKRSFKVRRPWF
jgi:hypothetical protein